jgi:hypothetical protein
MLAFHRDALGEGREGDTGAAGERSFWKDQVLARACGPPGVTT